MEGHNRQQTPCSSDGENTAVQCDVIDLPIVFPVGVYFDNQSGGGNIGLEPCKSRYKGVSCQLTKTHSYSHLAVSDGKRTCWTDDLRICSEMDMRFWPRPHPEQMADAMDEAPTRRAWWLELHTSSDLQAGTTISDLEHTVRLVDGAESRRNGSIGQPAAAPVSSLTASVDLVVPVCECAQPIASLMPFDWQCAKCKGVIPSPAHLEAL